MCPSFFSRFNASATVLALCLAVSAPLYAATFSDDPLLFGEPKQDRAPTNIPQAGVGLTAEQKAVLVRAGKAFTESRFEQAKTLLDALLSENSVQPDVWYLLGLTQANLNHMDEALAALDKAAGLYKNNASPLVIKGDILASLDRPEDAVDAYRAAATKDPSNWSALENIAISLEGAGNQSDAIDWYQKAIVHSPSNRLFPRFRLAQLLLNDARPNDAVKVLVPYVDSAPNDPVGLTALGNAQLRAELFEDAIETYQTVIQIAPDEPGLVARLATAQRSAGHVETAIDTLKKGHEKFPAHLEILYELGGLQGATGDYAGAAVTFEQGLSSAPSDPRLLKGLSLAHQRLGQIDQAIVPAQTLASQEGHTASDLLWLGVLYEQSGNRAKAISAYEKTFALDPANWIARNNLAALISAADPARAVTLAQKAADLSGQNPAVMDTLGWAHFNAGDTQKALGIFSALSSDNPDDPLAAYRLGRSLLAAGQDAKGRDAIKRALTLDPDFKYATEAAGYLSQ